MLRPLHQSSDSLRTTFSEAVRVLARLRNHLIRPCITLTCSHVPWSRLQSSTRAELREEDTVGPVCFHTKRNNASPLLKEREDNTSVNHFSLCPSAGWLRGLHLCNLLSVAKECKGLSEKARTEKHCNIYSTLMLFFLGDLDPKVLEGQSLSRQTRVSHYL